MAQVGIFRKTGATMEAVSVVNSPWKQFIDQYEADLDAAASSEEDEAIVDLWLEDPMSFMDMNDIGSTGPALKRVATGGMGLQRVDTMQHKTAASTNWDDEFANAKAHAASVLKNLGNAR